LGRFCFQRLCGKVRFEPFFAILSMELMYLARSPPHSKGITMQPSSDESRPFDPWLQSVTWLVFAPLALMGGCLAGAAAIRMLQPPTSELNGTSWLHTPSHVLVSIVAGSLMAILLGLLWHRFLQRGDLWRFIGNMVAMSCSVYLMLVIVYNTVKAEAFPLSWLAPALAIGIGLSLLQWYILRCRTRRAVWWLPIMTGSWTLVWLLVVGIGWLLND
jgi:hypothetical protein